MKEVAVVLTPLPQVIPDPYRKPKYRLMLGDILLADGMHSDLLPLYIELTSDPEKAERLYRNMSEIQSGQGRLGL